MNDNTHEEEEEQTEGWLSDRIIDDWIATLLRDTEGDYQPMPGDKYKLSVSESKARFKHGIMKLPPASHSMFECEISRVIDGYFTPSGVFATDEKYVQVIIPRLPGKYYIEVSKLKMLLSECVIDTRSRPCPGGEVVIAIIAIDRRRFLKSLRVRR